MAVADAAASCGAEEGDGDESAGGIGAELEAGNMFMGFIYYNLYNYIYIYYIYNYIIYYI